MLARSLSRPAEPEAVVSEPVAIQLDPEPEDVVSVTVTDAFIPEGAKPDVVPESVPEPDKEPSLRSLSLSPGDTVDVVRSSHLPRNRKG